MPTRRRRSFNHPPAASAAWDHIQSWPGPFESDTSLKRFRVGPRLTTHVRHRQKYAEMPVCLDQEFVFTQTVSRRGTVRERFGICCGSSRRCPRAWCRDTSLAATSAVGSKTCSATTSSVPPSDRSSRPTPRRHTARCSAQSPSDTAPPANLTIGAQLSNGGPRTAARPGRGAGPCAATNRTKRHRGDAALHG